MKTIYRLSSSTVYLNGRILYFPAGTRPADARGWFHNTSEPSAQPPARSHKKPHCSPGHGMPDHPFSGIAAAVKHRLEHPKQGAALIRPLTSHDFEEIRGEISLILAERNPAEKIDFATWKAIFRASRKVLRMKRKLERENLIDSIEELQSTNFWSDIAEPRAVQEIREREAREDSATDQFETRVLAKQARYLLACIRAAHRVDASRKRDHRKRIAFEYLRRAIRSMRGMGHSHETSRQNAYYDSSRFNAYVAQGEAQLDRKTEAEFNAWKQAETVRLMEAVSA